MKSATIYTKSDAVFSPCQFYRYTLERWWSPFAWHEGGRYTNFIMLNPSTADASKSDPTVTRCVGFVQDWGFDGLMVTNLFAYRSTDRSNLRKVKSPIGPDNDEYIQKVAKLATMVVCAWGNDGALLDRGRRVVEMLEASEIPLYCLGVTQAGHPKHPLYLAGNTKPIPYGKSAGEKEKARHACTTAGSQATCWPAPSNDGRCPAM